MRKISFHYLSKTSGIQAKRLKAFLLSQLDTLDRAKGIDIRVIFVDDETLWAMNKLHLNHDYYTDILTFVVSSEPDHLTAELYISVDRVKDNAKQFKQAYTTELTRVIFHGVLHVLGHADETPAQKQSMTELENVWLAQYTHFLRFAN